MRAATEEKMENFFVNEFFLHPDQCRIITEDTKQQPAMCKEIRKNALPLFLFYCAVGRKETGEEKVSLELVLFPYFS